MLLAFESELGLAVRAYVLDPRPQHIRPSETHDVDDVIRVSAVLFDETLEEMGLAPGRVLSVAEANGRFIPDNDAFTAELVDGYLSDWRAASELTGALASFRVPLPPDVAECPRFEQQVLANQRGTGGITAAVAVGDGTAVVYRSEYLHIGPGGVILETNNTIPGAFAASTDPDGIMITTSATVARLHVDPLRFEKIGTIEDDLDGIYWMASGPGNEAFVLTVFGGFGFFDGAVLRKVVDLDIDGGTLGRGGALWLGPGDGVALTPSMPLIARWMGEVVYDRPSDELGYGAATRSTLYGPTVVGSTFGEVLRYDVNAGWEPIGFRLGRGTQTITDYRDGLAYGTNTGHMGFVSPVLRSPCETAITDLSEIHEIAAIDGGLIVGGDDINGDWRWVFAREDR